MDDEPQFQSDFVTELSSEEDGTSHEGYTSTIFHRAKNFVVEGGNFNNIAHIHQAAPIARPDFPLIPLGHINLLRKIKRSEGCDVVRCKHVQNFVRTMYSARIHECKSNMTVALYQGDSAEERWREDVSRYSRLRHLYLAQLYGIVHTADLNAVVFHDDLVPHTELLDQYCDSHLSTVFFWACMDSDFMDVRSYISSVSGRKLHWSEYTVWIRPSAGSLCIDLTPPDHNRVPLANLDDNCRPAGSSLYKPPEDSEIVTSMSLHNYHQICYRHLGRWHSGSVSTNVPVKLGSIRRSSGPEYESSLEVASSDFRIYADGWTTVDPNIENYLHPINCNQEGTSIMENGWMRINSAAVVDQYSRRIYNTEASSWLAQANYVFNRLGITWGLEDFVFVDRIYYYLQLSGPTDNLPPGYLFLCPLAELQTDDPACFRIPEQSAYWSLDPYGIEWLSDDTAEDLGFPRIRLEVYAWGRSYDASVYNGICQFHEAKGFDPHSQEAALELGCSLFQLSCDRETFFTQSKPAIIVSILL
ncbi:hypothetical protein B0H16DRAFT_1565184 [Mycena metata]|uniref:Uncharacterized protein n=1 Tax=Mycena metata TaxID=1033252 RepID=A0AAD7IG87_9AGAR|nr:hypothetical protein B0H16DRAFT_1565184 [Mycena metata]